MPSRAFAIAAAWLPRPLNLARMLAASAGNCWEKSAPARRERNSAPPHAGRNGGITTRIFSNPKKITGASAHIVDASFITPKPENIVGGRAIWFRDLEVSVMTTEQFEREIKYQAALAIARSLLKNGIITDDDYAKTEAILRDKFSPPVGSYSPI